MLLTKKLYRLLLITVGAMLLLTSIASAAPIPVVVPASFATANGSPNSGPALYLPVTLQQAIAEAELTGLEPGDEITGIAFRKWYGEIDSATLNFSQYNISFSQSVNPPNALSMTLADNRGADLTVVRSGSLTINGSAYPEFGSPNDFGPVIPFSTPYTYQGGTLLMDLTHTGSGGGASNNIRMDAATSLGDNGRLLSRAPSFNAQTAQFSSDTALIVQFQVEKTLKANAGGPYSVTEGSTVQLDGSGSSDPVQDPTTLIYEWDLDNDGNYDDATGIMPTFSAAGLSGPDTKTVGLRVTNNLGEMKTDTATINILDLCDTSRTDANIIHGTAKNDKIKGTDGDDIIFGYGGNDRIEGFGGNDCLIGGHGNDQLFGDEGNDVLWGGEVDNETVYDDDDRDKLIGDDGDDELYGGGDRDHIDAGAGDDLAYGGDDFDKLYGKDGDDELHGEGGRDTLKGDDGDDTLTGGDDKDNIQGNDGDDTLSGDDGDDKLYGGKGDDHIDGGAGDRDAIQGSKGTDTCLNGESVKGCEL